MSAVSERPPTIPATPAAAPSGDRFVATALILLALVQFGYQPLAGELVPPLLIMGTIFLALGVAVARWRRRWLHITVAVFVLVSLVGSAPFIVSNITHPESVLSFLVEAFTVLAAASVVAGAVTGLRRTDHGARRPIAIVAGGLATVAVVIALVAAANVDSMPQQAGDATIEVATFHFPDGVPVPAGGAVLWVDNQDPVRHTLVIEGTDVHVELPATSAVRVEVDLVPGDYRYFCDVPGHEQMEGALDVQ